MAHKKGASSSRNGRDSNAQRLGIKRFGGHNNFVYGVAFAPDGKHIASGSVDKTVRVHDLATGNLVKSFEGHTNAVNFVAFSHDSRFVFSCGDGRFARN